MIDRCIKDRIEFLEDLLKQIDDYSKDMPEGNLRIAKHGNSMQYYCVTENGDTKGNYIRKKNIEFAKQLGKKQYLKKLAKDVELELSALNNLKNVRVNHLPENTICKENIYRRNLIDPLLLPDELFVERWQSEKYKGRGFADTEPEMYSKRGDRVRSKSEIIIADALYDAGIPYKYERPVYINGIGLIYIDFTILIAETREEKYWEHFGMMDDERYLADFFKKISSYTKSGIIPGKNFYMTFESKKNPINTKELQILINSFRME